MDPPPRVPSWTPLVPEISQTKNLESSCAGIFELTNTLKPPILLTTFPPIFQKFSGSLKLTNCHNCLSARAGREKSASRHFPAVSTGGWVPSGVRNPQLPTPANAKNRQDCGDRLKMQANGHSAGAGVDEGAVPSVPRPLTRSHQ